MTNSANTMLDLDALPSVKLSQSKSRKKKVEQVQYEFPYNDPRQEVAAAVPTIPVAAPAVQDVPTLVQPELPFEKPADIIQPVAQAEKDAVVTEPNSGGVGSSETPTETGVSEAAVKSEEVKPRRKRRTKAEMESDRLEDERAKAEKAAAKAEAQTVKVEAKAEAVAAFDTACKDAVKPEVKRGKVWGEKKTEAEKQAAAERRKLMKQARQEAKAAIEAEEKGEAETLTSDKKTDTETATEWLDRKHKEYGEDPKTMADLPPCKFEKHLEDAGISIHDLRQIWDRSEDYKSCEPLFRMLWEHMSEHRKNWFIYEANLAGVTPLQRLTETVIIHLQLTFK